MEISANDKYFLATLSCMGIKYHIDSGVIRVDEDINFDKPFHNHISYIPDNLKVDGHLILINCKNIHYLPENLSVSENLYLCGCRLHPFPSSLKVFGIIVGPYEIISNSQRFICDE